MSQSFFQNQANDLASIAGNPASQRNVGMPKKKDDGFLSASDFNARRNTSAFTFDLDGPTTESPASTGGPHITTDPTDALDEDSGGFGNSYKATFGRVEPPKPVRSEYSGSAWLSPYVSGFPPLSTQLQLVQCYDIGSDGFRFYFPLSFRFDIIAVRFCSAEHFVDLCAKIVEQKTVQIPGKGLGCLINCHFMGKLFLK